MKHNSTQLTDFGYQSNYSLYINNVASKILLKLFLLYIILLKSKSLFFFQKKFKETVLSMKMAGFEPGDSS